MTVFEVFSLFEERSKDLSNGAIAFFFKLLILWNKSGRFESIFIKPQEYGGKSTYHNYLVELTNALLLQPISSSYRLNSAEIIFCPQHKIDSPKKWNDSPKKWTDSPKKWTDSPKKWNASLYYQDNNQDIYQEEKGDNKNEQRRNKSKFRTNYVKTDRNKIPKELEESQFNRDYADLLKWTETHEHS